MKRFDIVIVSLVLFSLIIFWLAPAARADDQQEISDLEHKAAITTDPDEAMKGWESGDDVVLFDIMGPGEFVGQKAIHDHLAEFSGYKDESHKIARTQRFGEDSRHPRPQLPIQDQCR